MKNIYKLSLSLLAIVLLFACEDDSPKAVLKDQVAANNLEVLSFSSITLQTEAAADNFSEFTWSATDYGYPAAVSYSLQMDIQGFEFARAITLASTSNLSASVTNNQINNALLNLGINPGEEAPVAFRVMSDIGAGIPRVPSNAIEIGVVPFAPAGNPELYIVGDAQNWDLANALQLEYIGSGSFSGIGEFVNGGNFRFFTSPSWEADQLRFADFSTVPAEFAAAGDGDDNFSFTGTSGIYKVTVGTTEGTIVLEPANMPSLYIIGDDQGWDLGNAFSLEWQGGAKFQGSTTFSNGSIFRFFKQPDWGAAQYNYMYFEDVDDQFESDGGGDSNLRMLSATGTYSIQVDLINKTVTLN